jgi:epoxyqueuosine reductase
MKDLFCSIPHGFSSFDAIKDRLIDCRAKARLPENAKTVISLLFPYYLGEEYYENSNVSRYAVSEDYHIITKKITDEILSNLRREYPENVFEAFVDNSPLPEVRCAVSAGLGVMGKNNLFINKKYGSWVFLGEIVTDRYFPPYEGSLSFCAGCDRCVRACPMGALDEGKINPEKCLSYLSQKKGELPPEIAEKMAEYNCVWGCDICQKACPMNINAEKTPIREFFDTAEPHITHDTPIENRAFAWRGEKVIKRNLTQARSAEKNCR